MEVVLRDATEADAKALAAIYSVYVTETTISFEEAPVPPEEMARRIADVQAGGLPWLVAEQGGRLLGYAYATKWRARSAYRFAVESSVYLAPDASGRGLGTRLYQALLARLREAGLRTVIGGVALPNPASVALHEKLGFKPVACFERVGLKHDRWIDVAYWQLQLE